MMYRMKNIVTYDGEIVLPQCMYRIKNANEVFSERKADDINISNQAPNKKMTELEKRQDQLLKKLDILYDRIKTISTYCSQTSPQKETVNIDTKQVLPTQDEIVVAVSPDNLPWFINLFLNNTALTVKISWHIHSSVPNEKVPKIKAFVKKLNKAEKNSITSLRLIFRSGSADTELKLSSLAVPIVGNVNILRYFSYVYPNILPYNDADYNMDGLLDLCHQLERTPEKNREAIIHKLFTQQQDWIYKNEFSIVDVAVYNVVKQWQNSSKYVNKTWFDKCDKKFA